MSIYEKKYQSNLNATLFALALDRDASGPLHAQLSNALRQMILSKEHMSGLKLPASRVLAEELSVSRMTVTTAYDQLLGEGYLTARQGGGTFVADHLPHLATPDPLRIHKPTPPKPWLPFQPGLPDAQLFPHRQWARYLERSWRAPMPDLLTRPDPFGWYPLRAAICEHLSVWRGLECVPEQVIITAGATDAFDIICRSIFPSGSNVTVEDPGWFLLRQALDRSTQSVIPVRIDAEGLDAGQIPDNSAAAIVTPSRHYPTGISMPLGRRLALLEWAKKNRSLIVEDDYDSEFRYQGQPLPSLSGLDGLQRTLYLGSFSKLLSPALRIGYVVVPETLIDTGRRYLSRIGSQASLIPQPALAAFMESGDFATHLRRCRRTYAKRQATLVKELSGIRELLEIESDPSGMHLCCALRSKLVEKASDKKIAARCGEKGLTVRALSEHSVLSGPPQGLLLGYAAFDEEALTRAAQTLTDILQKFAQA